MDILRFITAGNVDDGKSTLTGRLLYETGNIKKDVLQSVTGSADDDVNLAHLADGLRSERLQGITIDVAYKYFTTATRKYIITDAPGHFQYTKNLVTGASAADLMIVLIDARNGITEQTRRHSKVAAFLGMANLVVAVNKMDVVGYKEDVFADIVNEYSGIAERLGLSNVSYVPVSALEGDNVVVTSANMRWYRGKTLMQYLENCERRGITGNKMRVVLQCALHDDDGKTVYFGKMVGGIEGDEYAIFPMSRPTGIKWVGRNNSDVSMVIEGQCRRGDIIAPVNDAPRIGNSFTGELCWLDSKDGLEAGRNYILRVGCREVNGMVEQMFWKTDIDTLERIEADAVAVNDFAMVQFRTDESIAYDNFDTVPETGRGILIHPATNNTVAAFVIKVLQ